MNAINFWIENKSGENHDLNSQMENWDSYLIKNHAASVYFNLIKNLKENVVLCRGGGS